jgi:hypothetical protein
MGIDEDNWVEVKWKSGSKYKYRMGVDDAYDLVLVRSVFVLCFVEDHDDE